MEIEAGLCVLLRQGPYYDSSLFLPKSRQEQTCTAHLTPMHIYSYTPCMYLQCTGPQWAGRRIKAFPSVYKSVHTGSMKGRVIAITQNGDLTKDVSTWPSTYIKTLTNKEKFPY